MDGIVSLEVSEHREMLRVESHNGLRCEVSRGNQFDSQSYLVVTQLKRDNETRS